jgi:hypothetical protein
MNNYYKNEQFYDFECEEEPHQRLRKKDCVDCVHAKTVK